MKDGVTARSRNGKIPITINELADCSIITDFHATILLRSSRLESNMCTMVHLKTYSGPMWLHMTISWYVQAEFSNCEYACGVFGQGAWTKKEYRDSTHTTAVNSDPLSEFCMLKAIMRNGTSSANVYFCIVVVNGQRMTFNMRPMIIAFVYDGITLEAKSVHVTPK